MNIVPDGLVQQAALETLFGGSEMVVRTPLSDGSSTVGTNRSCGTL
jgi:hypothetical protein